MRTTRALGSTVLSLGLVALLWAGCGSITEMKDGGPGGSGHGGTTGAGGAAGTGTGGTTGAGGAAGTGGGAGAAAGRGGSDEGGRGGGNAGRGGAGARGGSNGGRGGSGGGGSGGRGGAAGSATGGRGGAAGSGMGGSNAGGHGGAGGSGMGGSNTGGSNAGGRGGTAGSGMGGSNAGGRGGTGGGCVCPQIVDPVCGVDGNTYNNSCEAMCAGVAVAYQGACASACQSNSDCIQYADGVGDCCGYCLPKTAPVPPTVQCLRACDMPTVCPCVQGKCTAVPRDGGAAAR